MIVGHLYCTQVHRSDCTQADCKQVRMPKCTDCTQIPQVTSQTQIPQILQVPQVTSETHVSQFSQGSQVPKAKAKIPKLQELTRGISRC
ncbi:hypothetical protein CTI12_AA545830 [Artemisia annua]|uniref:Uncharacterized protein n=1 Tax=Artemisia annua TaxID=35608 RepID=A0A2U1KVT5_ARTAN|nr:hypothetical protein CTI12_AA545830 [Artemisia annua]